MGLRKKIKKLLYGYCPGFSGAFPYFGTKVYFPKGSELFNRVCIEGIYEHSSVCILTKLLKDNTTFIDVGANIGLISIPVLKNNTSCRGIAFEPSPNTLPYLSRTAHESELGHRWTIIGKAVGAELGELDFHLSSAEYGAYDGFKDTGRVPIEKMVKVPVTSIDLEWKTLYRPSISVIKIDVEGAEASVLDGARECISICKPFIFLEWNLTNLSAYDSVPTYLMKFAESVDYAVYVAPHMIKINSDNELLLHMNFSENFLLCPN